MKRILVTGALGQIGTELSLELRNVYGIDSVVVSYIRKHENEILAKGPHEIIDTTDANRLKEVVKKYNISQIYHMASILSAKGESNPQLAWDVNMNGLYHVLEVARDMNCSVFVPSSIAAFGPTSPKDNTPQDTIQRPTSMYGVTKVAGELLCDYYYLKYGLDTRGLRYPGIISWKTLPGGGTTDYAVDIYYQALQKKEYTCFLKEDTSLDMMYMPDAVNASIKLMEADSSRLVHRNAFNVTAMSMTPAQLAENIKKYIPDFVMKYDIDPVRQNIADSWPNSLNDEAAQKEWDWKPEFTMDMMTQDMLENLRKKLA
jgi:nucleoside-diphosphate-sugar epimerase